MFRKFPEVVACCEIYERIVIRRKIENFHVGVRFMSILGNSDKINTLNTTKKAYKYCGFFSLSLSQRLRCINLGKFVNTKSQYLR